MPGYIAEDRATVGLSESPEWQDFPLSAKVTTTLNDLGIERVHVGITNDSQLAALHAVRTELRLRPDAIAAYIGGLRGIGSGLIISGEIFRGAGGVLATSAISMSIHRGLPATAVGTAACSR